MMKVGSQSLLHFILTVFNQVLQQQTDGIILNLDSSCSTLKFLKLQIQLPSKLCDVTINAHEPTPSKKILNEQRKKSHTFDNNW